MPVTENLKTGAAGLFNFHCPPASEMANEHWTMNVEQFPGLAGRREPGSL
jgi:hypothetical protein